MAPDEKRAQRARDIIAATRSLFDERGIREAQIEDIAQVVGINRAIIYRHFNTKEELFAMTLIGYLDEVSELLVAARASAEHPDDQFYAIAESFFHYGQQYPAFVDCAQAFLRYRGPELLEQIRLDRLIELGLAVNNCLDHLVQTIKVGNELGEYNVPDPELLANILYTLGLGVLNLVTFQRSVKELNTGLPVLAELPLDEVISYVHSSILGATRKAAPRRQDSN